MEDATKKITRREALLVGAGVVGSLAALSSGTLPVLAQQTEVSTPTTAADDAEWKKVQEVFGVEGTIEPGDVLMISMGREDLHPSVRGIPLKPDFSFDTEIDFQHISGGAIVKYEFVLLDTEVNPVVDALFTQDLRPATTNINALHNHHLELTPKIKYMHGTTIGNAVQIAKALRNALSHSGQPFVSSKPGKTGLPNKEIEQILGGMGMISDSVLTVSVERQETFKEMDIVLKPAMQVESTIYFQAIGNGQAATTGEITVLPSEADAVTRAFRRYGIYFTALHNHELFIHPNAYYLHFFGTGDPLALARAVRAALNHTNSKYM